MLMARRDPPFHADAHNAASADFAAYPPPPVHRLGRFTTVMQLLGSLVAVPVGLASAYSLYHATFSVEASCQSLRAGIVAMLDKSVDATTRRMLVRRDVVTFEQNCATVDPDATTAFKALLAAEKTAAVAPAAPPATVTTPVVRKLPSSEVVPKEQAHKAEPRPQPVTVAAEPVRREPTVSDTQWVDAVRQALVTHSAEPAQPDRAKAPAMPTPELRPAQQELAAPAAVAVPPPLLRPAQQELAAPASAPVAVPVAPTLPPALSLAPPAAPQTDADHPVPPSAIPESPSPDKAAEQGRVRRWIAKIPLVNTVVQNAW